MASQDFSNIEVHGIQNDIVRYAYISYLLSVMLSSLIGDSFVLVGTLKYQAIKINSFLVVHIQNIAVVDIFACITYVLPQSTYYLFSNRWVLGQIFCLINSISSPYLTIVNQLLTCSMTFIKVLMVKFPNTRLVRNLTTKKAQILCLVIWIFSASCPTVFYLIEKEINLNMMNGICKIKLTFERWTVLVPLLAFIYTLAPSIVMIVSTILLVQHLIISRRLSRRIRSRQTWQGILVVVITATTSIVATLPRYIYRALEADYEDVTGVFHNEFLRIAESCFSLNLACNFYIYSLTVPSFRKFVTGAVQSFPSFWQKSHARVRLSSTGYSILGIYFITCDL